MRKQNLNVTPPKFVFMTETEFVKHFGENYEEAVKEHIINDKAVMKIHNINGCLTSIPIERAKYLLEKYYKMTKKSPQKMESKPEKQTKEVETVPEPTEVKRRNSSQSPEYA